MLRPYSESNVTNVNDLVGDFNSVIECKSLVILNEANIGGHTATTKLMSALKSLITDDTVRVGEKFKPKVTMRNSLNLIVASNEDKPVALEPDDRRFLVTQTSPKYKDDSQFFSAIDKSLTPECYSALLTHYSYRDISSFNPQVIPMTEAKVNLIKATMSPINNWLLTHYTHLISPSGVLCTTARSTCPAQFQTDREFENALADKCFRTQQRTGDERQGIYRLEPKYQAILNRLIFI